MPSRVPRLDAAALVAMVNRRTGAGLVLTGQADGGAVGAAYVRWPDGRAGVLTRSASPAFEIEGTRRVLARAAAAGLPVPAYQAVIDLGAERAIVQKRLPGAAPEQVGNRVVGILLDVVERFAGLGDGAPDLDLHLASSGPGFCLHETLAAHDERTRRLLARIREIGRDSGAEPGNDLVHLDFHPGNVLMHDGRLTGLVDWDDAGRGDRRFALVTLAFDLSLRLHARSGCRGLDRAGFGPVLGRLDEVPSDALRRWWAHMSLRLVDWTIRHGHGPDVVDWYLTIGERGLDRIEAGRPIRYEDVTDGDVA